MSLSDGGGAAMLLLDGAAAAVLAGGEGCTVRTMLINKGVIDEHRVVN